MNLSTRTNGWKCLSVHKRSVVERFFCPLWISLMTTYCANVYCCCHYDFRSSNECVITDIVTVDTIVELYCMASICCLQWHPLDSWLLPPPRRLDLSSHGWDVHFLELSLFAFHSIRLDILNISTDWVMITLVFTDENLAVSHLLPGAQQFNFPT